MGCGRTIGAGLPCCEIILGNCEDYLWQLAAGDVDLLVTDPPYGMSFQSGARKEKHQRIHGDDRLPVEAVQEFIKIPRLASYVFARWDNLWDHETLPKPNSVITWVKPGTSMGDLKHEHGRATEVALFYPGPEHKFLNRPCDVLHHGREDNDAHPTIKPISLIKQMLEWYDFETVLDPYSGSGATARAAKEMGKHFLAFEIDPAFHAKSVIRLNQKLVDKKITGPLFGDAQENRP